MDKKHFTNNPTKKCIDFKWGGNTYQWQESSRLLSIHMHNQEEVEKDEQ